MQSDPASYMENETEINILGFVFFLYCAGIVEMQKGILCYIYATRSSCWLVGWLMDRHINNIADKHSDARYITKYS